MNVQSTKQRAFLRYAFVASAEVTEVSSGAKLSARTSELGLGGCYVYTLNPFAEGALVLLRILGDQEAFEAKAIVVYCHPGSGMGLAFAGITADQQSRLEVWLTELVTQLRLIS